MKIHVLEVKHKKSFAPDALTLDSLRQTLVQFLEREHGNKCGKLLARMLKKQQSACHVHSLVTQGKKVMSSTSIAGEFQCFYKSLYCLPSDNNAQGGNTLKPIYGNKAFLSYQRGFGADLERPFTADELGWIVARLPQGKSPGPGGFTNLYYKKLLSILGDPMCTFFLIKLLWVLHSQEKSSWLILLSCLNQVRTLNIAHIIGQFPS